MADRTVAWLDSLAADDDWFCWMSFPDPHHPWDPPASEMGRIDWRDVPLPAGYPESAAEREALLDAKPRHWRQWYDGTLVSNYEAPKDWVPATMTADQVREVNARNAIECELIDEALGRVLAAVDARGWSADVDVIFTTDHGELQGDFGLLFKGPYHVDGLMRLPLVWRPAPSAGVAPAVVSAPVGLVDVAPTFCTIAGIAPSEWMQGTSLPVDDTDAATRHIEQVLTEWDSELFGVAVHLRTITARRVGVHRVPARLRPRRHRGRALRPRRRSAPAGQPLGRSRVRRGAGGPRRRAARRRATRARPEARRRGAGLIAASPPQRLRATSRPA